MSYLPFLLAAGQLSLATVLLIAATGKILRNTHFVMAIRSSGIGEPLVAPAAFLIPGIELVLAAALVMSGSSVLPMTFGATAILLGVFTAWMIWVYRRGLQLTCGCFGTGSADIGPRTIVRNTVLIILALGGGVLATRAHSPLPEPSIWLAIVVSSLGLCIMLALALRQGVGALVLTTKALLEKQASAAEKSL